MNSRKLRQWLDRHGADPLPDDVRQLASESTEMQRQVDDALKLDRVLATEQTPDPGDAYWANFAPRVARRIVEDPYPTPVRIPAPAFFPRPVWRWVPLAGVAVLAALIGRDVLLKSNAPIRMESEVPVTVGESREQSHPLANAPEGLSEPESETSPAPATENRGPATSPMLEQKLAGTSAASASRSDGVRQPVIPSLSPEEKASQTALWGQFPTTMPPASDSDDAEVWPERQVTRLGEIIQDTPPRTVSDDRAMRLQDSYAGLDRELLDDRRLAESADAAVPGRLLDAPRLRPQTGFSDSKSPSDAMRRLDEIAELRHLIGEAQLIGETDRSEDPWQELCALWYRIGQITDDRLLVDSALAQFNNCRSRLTDDDAIAEWNRKHAELVRRINAIHEGTEQR